LHDSRIDIEIHDLAIRIACHFLNEEIDREDTKVIIFQNAKVISWNKCRRSGHISRLNRKIVPYQYGYSEFYTNNGVKYVSILVFTNKNDKTNTGIYYPIVTIKYEEMIIKDA
jgi:hypothetical protein